MEQNYLQFQERLIHALVSDIKLIVDGKEFHKKCFCCKKCSVQLEKVKHMHDCKLAILSDVKDDNMSLILPLKIKLEKESTTPALLFKLM